MIGIWKIFYTSEFSIAVVWNIVMTIIFKPYSWAAPVKDANYAPRAAEQNDVGVKPHAGIDSLSKGGRVTFLVERGY